MKICKSFPYLSNLRTIDLSYNKIKKQGAIEIANSFKFFFSLLELNISGNNFGYDGNAIIIRKNISIEIFNKILLV